jgi:hypothetical protein
VRAYDGLNVEGAGDFCTCEPVFQLGKSGRHGIFRAPAPQYFSGTA